MASNAAEKECAVPVKAASRNDLPDTPSGVFSQRWPALQAWAKRHWQWLKSPTVARCERSQDGRVRLAALRAGQGAVDVRHLLEKSEYSVIAKSVDENPKAAYTARSPSQSQLFRRVGGQYRLRRQLAILGRLTIGPLLPRDMRPVNEWPNESQGVAQ